LQLSLLLSYADIKELLVVKTIAVEPSVALAESNTEQTAGFGHLFGP